ncbi:hypothetical protein GCM10017562_39900 [Streptomyces roseofulvus]
MAGLRGPAGKTPGRTDVSRFDVVSRFAPVSRFGPVSRPCGQARQAVKARQVGGPAPLSGEASLLEYLEPCRSFLSSEEPLEACRSRATPSLCSYSRWNS